MKKRPTFLTVWLSLMTISGVYTFYSYTLGWGAIAQALPSMPSWAMPVFVLLSIVNLIAVTLLWKWKMMGFHIFIGSAIMAAALNGMILGSLGVVASISALVGVAILYFAMKPVWSNFK